MEKYEDSLFYQLNSCHKYFNLLFENFFKELDFGISALEHLVLMIIEEKNDCCQRDLAKIIAKDRANTGKMVMALEKRGFIKIDLKTKNNRPAKILSLTDEGKRVCKEVKEKVNPTVENIYREISKEKIEQIKTGLEEFRNVVEKVVRINI